MRFAIPLLLLSLCAACSPAHPAAPQRPSAAAAAHKAAVPGYYDALGKRIWANECAGSVQGLVSWNAGEAFPSLGIGHFIWYPAGVSDAFDESFPKFVAYARRCGVQVPAFFNGAAPWPNKAAFLADRSGKADAMRRWLAANVRIQTQFIVERSNASLSVMMQSSRNPQAVKQRYLALGATSQGMYCLVDYVNFKGEGIKPEERYKGQGWGLLQVLEEMKPCTASAAPAEFSRAASAVMTRRVANAPAERGEHRWLQGWLNRCATYR